MPRTLLWTCIEVWPQVTSKASLTPFHSSVHMEYPDDEIRRQILGILDRQYEDEFDMPVSSGALAKELRLDRDTVDRHINSLAERGLVRVTRAGTESSYHVAFTRSGKEQWDHRQGDQRHLILRRRILETLKAREDQDEDRFMTSDTLASELEAGPNAICLNLIALEGDGLVEVMEMGGGAPAFIAGLTPEGRTAAAGSHE